MLSYKKGVKETQFRLGRSILGANHSGEMVIVIEKVFTIALRYTAASVFRTGDSLTPSRDSISAFQCRSARLTASRSFGYLS